MPKYVKFTKLDISKEVSARIRDTFVSMCDSYIEESRRFGLTDDDLFDIIYQRSCFLSKYVDETTDSPELREHRAIVKWLGVERSNKSTNHRLFTTDPNFGPLRGYELLRSAAKRIKRVLGDLPPDLLEKGSFSGGATTSVRRGPGAIARKFTGTHDVTEDALPLFLKVAESFPTWSLYATEVRTPRVVSGNIMFTVPKTAVIDRVACKEPDYNIFCQKAVGDYIRKRLRQKARIDLNDQSINQRLARKGSISGKLATIDLSSASDSLSESLVRLLLPSDWFQLLDSLRSKFTLIKGYSHRNEMFSSMGNGFTFELESLIFWAVACEVRTRTGALGEVSVYGDDIIVPSGCAGMLIKVLFWLGFRTNVSKTFVRGPFRESCGGHYYRGKDVTPFYLRRPIKDVSDLILFLNQYRKWLISTEMDTVENGWGQKNRFTRFWYNLAAFVPRSLWGGYDLSSRTQLVSPGPQKCELLRTTRRWARLETENQIGLYLSQLSVLDRRSFPKETDTVSFSSITFPTGKWVLRRCKVEPAVFGLVRPMFTFEQLD